MDDKPDRDLLTQLLEPVGFQTRTASNGTEAIALWQEWQPHLIWMELRMPVMDGYEANRIRTIERSQKVSPVPMIALTAIAFDEHRQ